MTLTQQGGAAIAFLLNKKDEEGNVINGDTLNVTKGAGLAAVIVALVTGINPLFDEIFGDDATPWVKAGIIMTVIGAWALIAAADALARGYASGQAASAPKTEIATLPRGLRATYERGRDVTGWRVAAIKLDVADPDKPQFLIVKADEDAKWAPVEDLRFS
jgi:hypothetical protein